MKTVLVLDGDQRSALAATRSLGRRGVRVLVAEEKEPSMAGRSRYCSGSFQYPSPYVNSDDFVECIASECRARGVEVLYPMTDISMYHVLKCRELLGDIVVPYASFDSYERLTDKWRFFEIAQQLGLSIPVTHFVKDDVELARVRAGLRFPLVIKPYRSRLFSGGRWLKAAVGYADSFEELEATIRKTEYFSGHPILLQEYIHGENQGLFTICDRGKPLTYFSNRRMRDKPPSGGVATTAESIAMRPECRFMAEKLFSHVGWHGVAMMEYKVRNDIPYILEINARFWATTQLAVDCGVDFPWLLYQLATGIPVDEIRSYAQGQKLRWLMGDLIHLYMSSAGKGLNRYESTAERRKALAGFWRFWDRRTKYEINRWNDVRPFIYELRRYRRRLHT